MEESEQWSEGRDLTGTPTSVIIFPKKIPKNDCKLFPKKNRSLKVRV